MRTLPRLTLVLLAGLFLFSSLGCPKKVEQNETGPGGLPKGIVEEGTPDTSSSPDFPVYPGSEQKASKAYYTTASLDEVVNWYADNLGMMPEVTGEHGETRTFVTEAYELVLIPMPPDSGGGVEMHFTLP